MSSDLVKIDQPSAITTLGPEFDGFGSLKVANMVLVQRTSKEGTPGTFRDKLSGREFNDITVIPLACTKTRVNFPEGELGASPICRSENGIVPVTAEQLGHPPVHHECATCPAASWAKYDRRTKTGDKPVCKESRRLLFVERETGLPFRINIGGSSIKPLRGLLDSIQRDALMAQSMLKEQRKPYDYFFSITPQKVEGRKGTYYVMLFGTPQVVKPDDRGKFGPMYEQFVTRANQYQQEVAEMEQTEEELSY